MDSMYTVMEFENKVIDKVVCPICSNDIIFYNTEIVYRCSNCNTVISVIKDSDTLIALVDDNALRTIKLKQINERIEENKKL